MSRAPEAVSADTESVTSNRVREHALPQDQDDGLARAQLSLEGLSVGDALGQEFMMRTDWEDVLRHRTTPDGCWRWSYTDDTMMAVSIVEVLAAVGGSIRTPWLRRSLNASSRNPTAATARERSAC